MRNLHNIFYSDCTHLHYQQQCTRLSFSLDLCQLLFLVLLMRAFWQVWGDIPLWFWFAFLWWLVMLSIFPCACCPAVCLLWKNACSGPLPIFQLSCFLILNCMSSWYGLDINPLLDVSFAHVISSCLFVLLIVSSQCKSFLVWCSSVSLVLLLLPLPEEIVPK